MLLEPPAIWSANYLWHLKRSKERHSLTDYWLLTDHWLLACDTITVHLSVMALFGSFALLIALVLCLYALVAGTFGLYRGDTEDRLLETARRAGIATFICVSASTVALVIAVFQNDFSLAYIRDHSNIALPGP
jgi:cytochrome bd-type quinol oxidase subunit 2